MGGGLDESVLETSTLVDDAKLFRRSNKTMCNFKVSETIPSLRTSMTFEEPGTGVLGSSLLS